MSECPFERSRPIPPLLAIPDGLGVLTLVGLDLLLEPGSGSGRCTGRLEGNDPQRLLLEAKPLGDLVGRQAEMAKSVLLLLPGKALAGKVSLALLAQPAAAIVTEDDHRAREPVLRVMTRRRGRGRRGG